VAGVTTESLPFTGSGSEGEAGIGVALVALGGLIVLAAGRRHEAPELVWIGRTWASRRPRNTVNLIADGTELD
jgi:hypothetical protein